MLPKKLSALGLALVVVLAAACDDTSAPTDPEGPLPSPGQSVASQELPAAQVEAWFEQASPEVLALPHTVFADYDETENRVVVGVENPGAMQRVETTMHALGIPSGAYEVQVTEPIRFMSSLRDEHRPTIGGVQIHFSNYLCTLGFNAKPGSGGYSFITNSHCSDKQGETDGTAYYQPTSSAAPSPIAFEVDDPSYFRGGECPRGNKCRYSDAARAAYDDGVEGHAEIARTTGVNSGSITMDGTFDVASQDDATVTFAKGTTLDKTGRTTGWTQGQVTRSCVDVGVSGSNIALLCQTLVENDGTEIVGSGDSGSPVFSAGSSSATLVGILWGGNTSGDLFVFSPLKQVQDELGALDATVDGTGSATSGGGGGDDDGGGGNCPPGNPDHKNCS